jgi:AcrR family transcriptional regulator
VDSRHRPHVAADAVDLSTTMALPSSSLDGRRQRSERTRQSIMEAYIELLREKPEIPTAAQIAARAGISTRSIFERFVDLQGLSLATVDHAFAMGEAQAVVRNVDGDRPTRLRSHVETRAQTCERWLPVWRVVVANQGKLDELRNRIRFIRQAIVKRMELMYRPELEMLSAEERRDLLIALESLIDFESWGRMREGYGLSFEEACSVWMRIIDRMLPPTPPARP